MSRTMQTAVPQPLKPGEYQGVIESVSDVKNGQHGEFITFGVHITNHHDNNKVVPMSFAASLPSEGEPVTPGMKLGKMAQKLLGVDIDKNETFDLDDFVATPVTFFVEERPPDQQGRVFNKITPVDIGAGHQPGDKIESYLENDEVPY